MKKLLLFISLLCLTGLFACGSGGSDKEEKRAIHGTAAIGAYMPNGAVVELRPAAIPTGNTILAGTTWNGHESWVAEENPATIITGQITGDQGEYTIDVTGTTGPYLIRIQDPVSLKWYYSFADTEAEIANVNPYTDWMVRAYYYGRWFVLIDDCFTAGTFTKWADGMDIYFLKTSYGFDNTNIYWYNMPVPMPDGAGIARNMTELQYIVNYRWGVDIGDVLTRDWVVGDTYDTILDGSTLDYDYISTKLSECFFADDMMDHGIAFYDLATQMLHVEIWTPYNYCYVDWPDGTGNTYLTLVDSVNGLNHFSRVAPYTILRQTLGVKFNTVPYSSPFPGTAISFITFIE